MRLRVPTLVLIGAMLLLLSATYGCSGKSDFGTLRLPGFARINYDRSGRFCLAIASCRSSWAVTFS